MIFNDITYPITNVEANYKYFIKIKSNEDISIVFSFNLKELDYDSLKLNETINFIPYIHWDITLVTKEEKYLFDISNNKVELTKLDKNKYELKVDVKNPNMIIPGNIFDNFSFKTEFEFNYNYKPQSDKSILDRVSKEPQPNLFNILDKKSALISKYVYDIEEIKKRIKKLYYIPNESADNLGANVLVIGKKKVICSNTDTTRILRKAGYKVLCCEYDEMIKLGGGIACSTLPIMM